MFGLSKLLAGAGGGRGADGTKPIPDRSELKQAGACTVPSMQLYGEHHDAKERARKTIEFAHELGFSGSLLASHMQELHEEMCRELGWLPARWNPVARAISLQTTGGKKIYAYVNGRRRRIYPLPQHSPECQDSPAVPRNFRVVA